MQDDLGDRMKKYEAAEADRRLRGGPVCARIDGRSFSTFTKPFKRPYDPDMSAAMQATCKHLVKETHALIGFVQSDEISLIWDEPTEESSMIFDGRVGKLTSVLASMATIAFAKDLRFAKASRLWNKMPHFDARVWTVPSQVEAANVIVWRSQDARKNGVSSAARAHMSAKEMHGLNQMNLLDAMTDRGVDYLNWYPDSHQYGTYYQRKTVLKTLTSAELAQIPAHIRAPKGSKVERSVIQNLQIKYFGDVQNRVGVIFDGEEPIYDQKGQAA